MKSKRFSVEQAVPVIMQREVGLSIDKISREMGVAEGTLCIWKKKDFGLELDQVRELKKQHGDIVAATEKSSNVLQREKVTPKPIGEFKGLVSTSYGGM
ncbi:transposase [Idiomarina loihiensis]|uniref:transposase n=1 Tax=Idiomarina loihiensis TaxID=135577 RepID=UPI00384FB881